MKKSPILLSLLVCIVYSLPIHSQNLSRLTFEEALVICEKKAHQQVAEYTKEKIESKAWDTKYDALTIEFTSDTLFIESVCDYLQQEGMYSTADMRRTALYMIDKYDELLNKYYRRIMNRLTAEDQTLFRNSQRNWLKYRDSEREVEGEIIANGKYTGGGTMWIIVSATRNLEVVQERVSYFYQILSTIGIDGEED